MIYAQPGQTFEAVFPNRPTGLVGTAGVRVLDNQGGTPVPRQTTGIVEAPAGSGLYAATLEAPDVAGQFTVLFDQGGGVSPANTAIEELVVATSIPTAPIAAPDDLCSLDAVRTFLGKKANEHEQDVLLQLLIGWASTMIMQEVEREFAPLTADATRTFEYSEDGRLYLAPFDLRGDPVAVTIDVDGTSPTVLTTDEFRAAPVPAPDGVFTALRLYPSPRIGRWGFRQLSIRGAWGFPAVPRDVEFLAVLTVAIWYRRDAAAFESTFSLDEDRVEHPKTLPSATMAGLDKYRRWVV